MMITAQDELFVRTADIKYRGIEEYKAIERNASELGSIFQLEIAAFGKRVCPNSN